MPRYGSPNFILPDHNILKFNTLSESVQNEHFEQKLLISVSSSIPEDARHVVAVTACCSEVPGIYLFLIYLLNLFLYAYNEH